MRAPHNFKSSPLSFPFTPFTSDLPDDTRSGASATPAALKTPFLIWSNTHHLPSSFFKRGLQLHPSYSRCFLTDPNKYTTISTERSDTGKRATFRKAHLPNNKTFKKRKIGSILSCSTWVLFITSLLFFILNITDH